MKLFVHWTFTCKKKNKSSNKIQNYCQSARLINTARTTGTKKTFLKKKTKTTIIVVEDKKRQRINMNA